jgi:outer membrane protein TolC
VVTLPFFDATRRAKARESAADAEKAEADADSSRNVLSEQTSAMRHALRELGAQQRVAQLQSELAQEQLKTVETQFANGTGSPNAGPVTPKEEQQAHIDERERYEDMLDANFSLVKVQLNLLRATGQLDSWLRSAAGGSQSAGTTGVTHSFQEP